MQIADSKTNLSALRKLYLRLEKLCGSAGEHESLETDTLVQILIVEAIRRIQNAPKEIASASKTADVYKITDVSKAADVSVINDVSTIAETSAIKNARTNETAKSTDMIAAEFVLQLKRSLPEDIFSAFSPLHDDHSHNLKRAILLKEMNNQSELLALFDERVFGYFYQFSCEAARAEALLRIQSGDKKTTTRDLISFTQLYTPDWVADYLLQSALLPQWRGTKRSNKPEDDFSARQLKVLDPACGAGHILLRAFDFMLNLHLQEGTACQSAISQVLSDNLFGCDLDLQSLFVCGFSLIVKATCLAGKPVEFKLNLTSAQSIQPPKVVATPCVAHQRIPDFEPGTLCREWPANHLLSGQYHAVVANPPYIGRRLMDRRFKQYLKQEYPTAHHDLSAAFLLRALELTRSGGRVAFITQSSLLYLPSYGAVRKKFVEDNSVESVVELGTRVFPLSAGEKINSMLLVLQSGSRDSTESSRFLDLGDIVDKPDALQSAVCAYQSFNRPGNENELSKDKSNKHFVNHRCAEFVSNRECAFNYKCPPILAKIMLKCKRLGEFAEIKQGLATSDNKRFVRFWWDVSESDLESRWRPYVKGAGSQRWFAPCQTVVDWNGDGRAIKDAVEINYPYLKGRVAWVVKNEQFYFKPGLTFSFVSTGNFSVRRMCAGSIFDVGGSALFCNEKTESFLLAYLNSSFAAVCADLLNPTFNFQVGDIKQIPVPEFTNEQVKQLRTVAEDACYLKSALCALDETNFEYKTGDVVGQILNGKDPALAWSVLEAAQLQMISRLAELEATVDEIILQSLESNYSFSKQDKLHMTDLLLESKCKQKANRPSIASAADFAGVIVRAFVQEQAAEGVCIHTSASNPFSDSLSPLLKEWMERSLEMPIRKYLQDGFNRDQERIFENCPQIVSYFDKSTDCLVFFVSRALRRFQSNDTRLNDYSDYGYKLCRQLAAQLRATENWTGKDFHAAIKELFISSNLSTSKA